ncbi:MAG: YciI family protein [Erythrobacter sp.]
MRMFCFHCRDGEDGGRLRAIHRPAHLAFIHANAEHFVIVGPLKRADGLIIGSLLIVKAADEAAARAILAEDPYLTGGVWQSIRVDEFTPLLGDWV